MKFLPKTVCIATALIAISAGPAFAITTAHANTARPATTTTRGSGAHAALKNKKPLRKTTVGKSAFGKTVTHASTGRSMNSRNGVHATTTHTATHGRGTTHGTLAHGGVRHPQTGTHGARTTLAKATLKTGKTGKTSGVRSTSATSSSKK